MIDVFAVQKSQNHLPDFMTGGAVTFSLEISGQLRVRGAKISIGCAKIRIGCAKLCIT